MNTAESKFFSEETGTIYENFSLSNDNVRVKNLGNPIQYSKAGFWPVDREGNMYFGEPFQSLPNVLTEIQFMEKITVLSSFRFSLPSAYIDGGNLKLPEGFSFEYAIGHNSSIDPRISFAYFLRKVCTDGSTYLTQIKKWNCDGQWLATFDFSVEKPKNVHLIYDGEQKGKDPYWEIYGAGLTKTNVDVSIPYDDFFVKYDALDPQCYDFESECSDSGIPVGELVEPITSENRGCLGRIDVDFANFTSDDAQKDKHLSEDFQKYLIDKKTDKGFLPHMTLENQDGIPYGYLLKEGEDQNWLPIYVNVYLWKHRGEWLFGQRPYFTDLSCCCDRDEYEKTRCKQRNTKKLLVKMPIDMKGNLAAQMREVYIAYQEWRNGGTSCPNHEFDVLFSEAARLYGSLNTAWNQINDGKYKNFESVVDCLNSIRESFPSYVASCDDILAYMISDIHNATKASQPRDEMASRSFKSTLGILCSNGIGLKGNDEFSNELELMCVDLEMADLLENELYPRVKAYQRLKRVVEKRSKLVKAAAISIPSIFNFDCFHCLFKQYAIDKLHQWAEEFKPSCPEDLIRKLAAADKQDIQKATERADETEEEIRWIEHEIKGNSGQYINNLDSALKDCTLKEKTRKYISNVRNYLVEQSHQAERKCLIYRPIPGDFEKDILNANSSKIKTNLYLIFLRSLKEAIHHSCNKSMISQNVYERYFENKNVEKFISKLLGAGNLTNEICNLIREEMADIDWYVSTDLKKIMIGNEYYSIDIFIAFMTEFFINAIKNMSGLPRNLRKLTVYAEITDSSLHFFIENTFPHTESMPAHGGFTHLVKFEEKGFGARRVYHPSESGIFRMEYTLTLPMEKEA